MRIRYLMTVLLIVASIVGCNAALYMPSYTIEPVTVQVIDGDTGRPVAGAEVKTAYSISTQYSWPNQPDNVIRRTDEKGYTVLPASNFVPEPGHIFWVINPPRDYLYFSVRLLRQGARIPREFEAAAAVGAGRAQALILVYRKPKAKLYITIPDGYQGLLSIEKIPDYKRQLAGKRTFRVSADSRGRVKVPTTPLLLRDRGGRSDHIEWIFQQASGRKLNYIRGIPNHVHWIARIGYKSLLFVGTRTDATTLKKKEFPYPGFIYPHTPEYRTNFNRLFKN